MLIGAHDDYTLSTPLYSLDPAILSRPRRARGRMNIFHISFRLIKCWSNNIARHFSACAQYFSACIGSYPVSILVRWVGRRGFPRSECDLGREMQACVFYLFVYCMYVCIYVCMYVRIYTSEYVSMCACVACMCIEIERRQYLYVSRTSTVLHTH